MQNRIVTKEDFITAAYNMPPSFGSIKKVNVYQDSDSFNQRNINLFVLSQDNLGNLQKANSTVKSNLKTYLSRLKMMNDTIDILDANIINLQINYKVAGFSDASKYSVLDSAKESLANFFQSRKNFDIGEPFSITDVFSVLKNSPLVLDVLEVDVTVQSGPDYSSSNFSTILNKTRDGRKINCPPDSIFEIKFPNTDIVGTIL